LVSPFRLSVAFRVVTGSEVKLHVECLSERTEKFGDEFGTTVRGDMFGNSVFGEHVSNEQDGKVFRGTVDGHRDEDGLLGEPVHDYENGVATRGCRESFYEIH
jgi:hypothetical protein